jgi:hypothetical protein
MTQKSTKRTKRSATSVAAPAPPSVDLMPAGFLNELDAAKFLGVTPAQLRNYRYRWNHEHPGEHGPLFFEGTSGTGAKRIAYRREDLVAWQRKRSKVEWIPKGDAPKGDAPKGRGRA